MPYWVVSDDMELFGPYDTSGMAQLTCDRIDCGGKVMKTESTNRAVAKQELRLQLGQSQGAYMLHKNFRGVK